MNKKNIAVVFGGKSEEHEISVISAKFIANSIDRNSFNILFVGISKKGKWRLLSREEFLKCKTVDDCSKNEVYFKPNNDGATLCFKELCPQVYEEIFSKDLNTHDSLQNSNNQRQEVGVDVAFPILHGPFGEDGRIQGFFEILGIPYVGCGVLTSSIGNDKIVFKKIMESNSINVVPYEVLTSKSNASFQDLAWTLGDGKLFVKTPTLGSSIGIYLVSSEDEFRQAVNNVLSISDNVLVEAPVFGRELECAILTKEGKVITSEVGEIKAPNKIYSYEEKYGKSGSTELIVSAKLSAFIKKRIRIYAKEAFEAINGSGMARVDFFLDRDEGIYINEINTIPGCTPISMFPSLFDKIGISPSELVSTIINEAFYTFNKSINRANSEFLVYDSLKNDSLKKISQKVS